VHDQDAESWTLEHEDLMKSPAFALESEVDPEVALQMSLELEMIRGFPPPQRVAAKFLVARHFMAFVTAARRRKEVTLPPQT
jgi:hypothetical protein